MIGHNHLGKNGRFGNQMFQYAATRGIAAKHNYDWCIPDGPKTDDEFEDEDDDLYDNNFEDDVDEANKGMELKFSHTTNYTEFLKDNF